MNRTIVVLSRNRPIQDRTRQCIDAMMRAGAAYLEQTGCADVALARCDALTQACNSLRQLNERSARAVPPAGIHPAAEATWKPPPPRDTVLMVDDDMVFSNDQAQALIDCSRETGVAVSAVYATLATTVAATRIAGTDRWLSGLGLIAIPAGRLFELEHESETFAIKERSYVAFTWCGPEKNAWYSEDYRLCQRLGGVYLLPIAVGHLKVLPIYPDDETIAAIREDRRITGDADTSQLERITHTQAGES